MPSLAEIIAAQKGKSNAVNPDHNHPVDNNLADGKIVVPPGMVTIKLGPLVNQLTPSKTITGGGSDALGKLKEAGQNSGDPPNFAGGGGPLSNQTATTSPSVEEFNHPNMVDKLGGEAVEQFRQAINILHTCFDQPELVSNATRNILREMREHPEFNKILAPEDCQLMVRALRTSYGIVASSKLNGKEKRKKSSEREESLDDLIGNLDVDLS